MPFAYYERLSRGQQRVYRQSDEIAMIRLPGARALAPLVAEMTASLAGEDRSRTQSASNRLLAEITARLGVTPLRAEVLAVRPSRNWGELHGLYTPAEHGRPARATVWMRTAQRRQIVAFRTYLRTLLHELCHHLDYELLQLPDSFHTEGFYKRESSLLKQILEEGNQGERPRHG
ncbi:MAG TPA: hypothetical protein VLG48_06765 [Candidatus Methylomirabilis sp.]|nr:hypothetical protein [Candidatus Methylomirabilis sp.]